MRDAFVIQWNLAPKSYYQTTTRIGPAFGATPEETPKFRSQDEAQKVIDRFPIVAACGCIVVPVDDPRVS